MIRHESEGISGESVRAIDQDLGQMQNSAGGSGGTASRLSAWRSRATSLLTAEPFLWLGTTPLIWFPGSYRGWLLMLIPFVWVIRWFATGRLSKRTPIDLPVAVFMLLLPLSLIGVTDWERAAPKLFGIVLGFALVYALANVLTTPHRIVTASVFAALVIAPAIALAGLVGSEWPSGGNKILPLQFIYERLPRLIDGVTKSNEAGTINRNETAGALTYFVSLGFALIMAFRAGVGSRWRKRVLIALVAAFAFVLFVVVLTQSRSGLFGIGLGLLLVIVIGPTRIVTKRMRAMGTVGVLAGLLVVIAFVAFDATRMSVAINEILFTIAGRFQLWLRAIYMLQDSPFTGIGLTRYQPLAQGEYAARALAARPSFEFGPIAIEFPTTVTPDFTHAHSFLLQSAVDFGIPATLAICFVLLAFFWGLWRVMRYEANPRLRWISAGIAGGMVAFLAFGVNDTLVLGARGGIGFWIILGLGVSVAVTGPPPIRRPLWSGFAALILALAALPLMVLAAGNISAHCAGRVNQLDSTSVPALSSGDRYLGLPLLLGLNRDDRLAEPFHTAVAVVHEQRGCAPEEVALRWLEVADHARTKATLTRVDEALARQGDRFGGRVELAASLDRRMEFGADRRALCSIDRLRDLPCRLDVPSQ